MRTRYVVIALLIWSGIANAGQVTVFSENFESTVTGWSLSGDWQVGTPSVVGPTAAFQGTRCAATTIAGYYSNLSSSTMVSPTIQLPATATQVTLSYYEWYYTEACCDFMYVDISTNSGSTWTALQSGIGGANGVGSTTGAWTLRTFDLTSYKSNNVLVRFRFASDGSDVYPGWYIDSLSVVASIMDTVNLPHIAVSPTSIRIGTHDTTVKALTICNTGIHDTLQFSISNSGAGANILSWTYGVNTGSSAYLNTISSITQKLPNATVTATATTDAATLTSLLRTASVFLIPAQEYTTPTSTIGAAFAPVIDSYVRSGGVVIVLGPTYEATFLTYAGLDTMAYSYNTSSSYTVTINTPTHPVFDSVSGLSTQMYTSYWTTSSAATVLAAYSGYAVCSERVKGSGYIYMLGYDFYSLNTATWGKMLNNCIKRSSFAGIVSVDTASGLVRPGTCRTVTLTFNRDALPPGSTIFPLRITHNAILDPNPVSVPCTLLVDSSQIAHISVTPASFKLSPTDPSTKTLTICNTGTRDTLRYTVTGAPNILTWTYGTGSYSTYTNTVSSILAQMPNARISSTMATDAATLASLLRNVNVFLIPAQEYTAPASTIGAALASTLDTYVRSGGIVIVLSPYYESTFLTYAGLDTLSSSNYTSSSYTVTIASPTDPVFDSVPSLSTSSYTSYWTRASSATVLATYSGYAVCSEKAKGAGYIYMLGYDFSYTNTTTWGKMLVNCIKRNSSGTTITADTGSGVVRPGGCKTVTLTFHRDGLMPGATITTLRINHNALLEPNPVSVPCTLSVDSTTMAVQAPSMSVPLFTSDTVTKNVTIQNTGSSMLSFSVSKTSNGPPAILINEVNDYYPWVELLNAGGGDVAIGGWRLVWTDNNGSSGSYTIPTGTIFKSHHCILFFEGTGASSDTFFYTGSSMNWTYTSDLSISLINSSGQGVDFFKTSGDPSNPPSGTTWIGAGVIHTSSVYDYYRSSTIDNNSAADWYTSTSSIGTSYSLNPGEYFQTPYTTGYITASADSLTLGPLHAASIHFRYDASSLVTAGVYIDTFQIMHNAKNIRSPVVVVCTMTVKSNIPSLVPYLPDPTIQRKPKLVWHPVASATAYTIQISQYSNFSSDLAKQQTTDTTFTPLVNLPLGNIYWHVECDLNPRYSPTDNFFIQSDSVPLVIPVTPDTIVQQTGLVFKWHHATGATSYKIWLNRIDTIMADPLIIAPASDTSFTDAAQLTKGVYVWYVAANTNFNSLSYPDTFVVVTSNGVIARNQANLPKSYGLSVINAAGCLRITAAIPKLATGQSPVVSIDLFDVRGALVRKVYSGVCAPGYYQFPVVTQNIASGVYYLRMRAGSMQKLAPVYLKR